MGFHSGIGRRHGSRGGRGPLLRTLTLATLAAALRLDAGVAKERRAAQRLIDTLLARDREGNLHALARRMGVQGIIFDCHAWWAGMDAMGEYSYCYRNNGELRHGLDRTQAHRNHIHLELNWDGARKRTSFWRSPLSR